MSADKYPCIFSRQMETIVYIFHSAFEYLFTVLSLEGIGGKVKRSA